LAVSELCASFGSEYVLENHTGAEANWDNICLDDFRTLLDGTAEDLELVLQDEVPRWAGVGLQCMHGCWVA